MNSLAIMLGRVSPPMNNRLQFHPTDWEAEFPRAKEMGFDHIEWFLDQDIPGFDPIAHIWLRPDVVTRIDDAREVLPISSVDAGMYPTFGERRGNTIRQFEKLLPVLIPRLSTGIINIPLLEHAAPKSPEQKKESKEALEKILMAATAVNGRIALETEMPYGELREFIDTFKNPSIGVCYDIGNCTSYGFDCAKDIRELGKRVFEVHLKDRKVGSTQSLLLGTGDADFDGCFTALAQNGYQGVYTLQAWRGPDYLKDARYQLDFARQKLAKYI